MAQKKTPYLKLVQPPDDVKDQQEKGRESAFHIDPGDPGYMWDMASHEESDVWTGTESIGIYKGVVGYKRFCPLCKRDCEI